MFSRKSIQSEDEEKAPGVLANIEDEAKDMMHFLLSEEDERESEILMNRMLESLQREAEIKGKAENPEKASVEKTTVTPSQSILDGFRVQLSNHRNVLGSLTLKEGFNPTLQTEGKDSLRNVITAQTVRNLISSAEKQEDAPKKKFSEYPIDAVINHVADSSVYAGFKVYPDRTIAMNVGFSPLPLSILSEVRIGKVQELQKVSPDKIVFKEELKAVYETNVAFKTRFCNVNYYKQYTNNKQLIQTLFRLYKSPTATFEAGVDAEIVEGAPANASFGFRSVFPMGGKRTAVILTGNPLGYLTLSCMRDVSKQYGIKAATQFRFISSTKQSEFSAGIEIDPSKAADKSAYIFGKRNLQDYVLKARVDSRKGAAVMLKRRNVWENVDAVVYAASNTPLFSDPSTPTPKTAAGTLKFGAGLQVRF